MVHSRWPIDPTLTMSLGSDPIRPSATAAQTQAMPTAAKTRSPVRSLSNIAATNTAKFPCSSALGADLETENWKDANYQCDDGCAPMDGCKCYDTYCRGGEQTQGEAVRCEAPSARQQLPDRRSLAWSQVRPVASLQRPHDCVRDRKLVALDAACWLPIQFTRPWDILSGSWVSGTANPHKAGTLLFRYSNGTPEELSIQIRDQIRNLTDPGTGFQPTGSWDNYDNKYIYPIYPGRTTFSPGTPGIEIAIAGDPASQFPHLDYAQNLRRTAARRLTARAVLEYRARRHRSKRRRVHQSARRKDSDFRLASLVRVNLKLRDADPAGLDVTLSRSMAKGGQICLPKTTQAGPSGMKRSQGRPTRRRLGGLCKRATAPRVASKPCSSRLSKP